MKKSELVLTFAATALMLFSSLVCCANPPIQSVAKGGRIANANVELLSLFARKPADLRYYMDPHYSDGVRVSQVAAILEKGANVNARDKYGRTPLSLSSEHGNLPCSRFLISGGANVNSRDNYGMTPLMSATSWGKSNCVALLIASGAHVSDKDVGGRTALIFAAGSNKFQCMQLLVSHGADVNAQSGGVPLLFIVILTNDIQAGKLLISHGANVNS